VVRRYPVEVGAQREHDVCPIEHAPRALGGVRTRHGEESGIVLGEDALSLVGGDHGRVEVLDDTTNGLGSAGRPARTAAEVDHGAFGSGERLGRGVDVIPGVPGRSLG